MSGGFKFTMIIPLLVGLVMRNSVDFKNEENIQWARRFFVFGKAIELIIYGMLYFRIVGNKSEDTIMVSEKDLQPPNPLAKMLGVEEEEENSPKEKLSHGEYDLRVLMTEFKQMVMQTFFVLLIHVQWGVPIPMVMSVLMALLNKPDNALFRIYILQHSPYGDLKRPFKKKSALDNLMGAATKKQKKKKEKGRNGKKKRK